MNRKSNYGVLALGVIIVSSFAAASPASATNLKNNACNTFEICWYNEVGGTMIYDNDNGTDSDLSAGTSRFYPSPNSSVQTNNSFDFVWNRFPANNFVRGYNTGFSGVTTGNCVGSDQVWNMTGFNATANITSAHRPRSIGQCQ